MFSFDLTKIIYWLLVVFRKSREEGTVAEWMEPEWFKFSGGAYSYFVPQKIDIWLQVYFRNTTTDPQILQSVNAEFTREGRFWGGHFSGIQPIFGGEGHQFNLPRTIAPRDSLPLYFRFTFKVGADSPERFIQELNASPSLVFKISYSTKDDKKTKEKNIERALSFKEEYKKIYRQFLESAMSGGSKDLVAKIQQRWLSKL